MVLLMTDRCAVFTPFDVQMRLYCSCMSFGSVSLKLFEKLMKKVRLLLEVFGNKRRRNWSIGRVGTRFYFVYIGDCCPQICHFFTSSPRERELWFKIWSILYAPLYLSFHNVSFFFYWKILHNWGPRKHFPSQAKSIFTVFSCFLPVNQYKCIWFHVLPPPFFQPLHLNFYSTWTPKNPISRFFFMHFEEKCGEDVGLLLILLPSSPLTPLAL